MGGRILVISLLLSGALQAKELGTWGELYPVAEEDMLSTIHNRLQSAAPAAGEPAVSHVPGVPAGMSSGKNSRR